MCIHLTNPFTVGAILLDLATITIGLLIALGLEGCVEWQHHRHLVHEAEASLRAEIKSNESTLKVTSWPTYTSNRTSSSRM